MVFVSYSWINEKPDFFVLELVERLRNEGINATCDVMFIQDKSSINFVQMMAEQLLNSDKVIIILSEAYKEKADSFKGGVGQEYRYIINDITNNENKYILVSKTTNFNSVLPDFLKGRQTIYVTEEKIKEGNIDELLHKLNNIPLYIFSPVNPKIKKLEPLNLSKKKKKKRK